MTQLLQLFRKTKHTVHSYQYLTTLVILVKAKTDFRKNSCPSSTITLPGNHCGPSFCYHPHLLATELLSLVTTQKQYRALGLPFSFSPASIIYSHLITNITPSPIFYSSFLANHLLNQIANSFKMVSNDNNCRKEISNFLFSSHL